MNYCIKRVEFLEENKEKPRIPRPPNAFMLYANENRKKMSQLHPTESNKDISKRLGSGWKSLDEDEKNAFFEKAKAIGAQHKKEFPDYVYNPKEARIRKAMRDASRERSIGATAMLSRTNARRSAHSSWVSPHDELLMSPMGMRGPMSSSEGPSCPFSMPGQFMGGMNAYNNKMETPLSSNGSVHTNYMQSNPLAQLQQHTEMWPDYQTMRPRSSGNPYLMGGNMAQFSPPPDHRLMLEKAAPNNAEMLDLESNKTLNEENVIEMNREDRFEHKDNFIPQVYSKQFENKIGEESKVRNKAILNLPLSSQSLSSNLFSNDLNYQNNYILEYFQETPSMFLLNVTTPNGITFPYATYSPLNLNDSITNETRVFENASEPYFFHTDVGYLPLCTSEKM